MPFSIEDIVSRQIIDSRGNPTVETDVILSCGILGRAAVPSGASTGMYEAVELRDDDRSVFDGKSVWQAVDNVNSKIAPKLIGEDVRRQFDIDNIMITLDDTQNKSKLGANAILSVSLAVAKAASLAYKMPLYRYLGGINSVLMPVPIMNILNGGVHANNNIDFQEFMIAPVGASDFQDAVRVGAEVFHSLKRILLDKGLSTAVGDEGGFAPNLDSNEEAIELIISAIRAAGYSTEQVKICMDTASSELYKNGVYELKGGNIKLSSSQMVDFFIDLVNKYPIISIEDGLDENDFDGWQILSQKLAQKCQLIGDDLFVTNTKRLKEGIKLGIANSILIKPNQIGSLAETLKTIRVAQKAGYSTVISHRSGETEDTFIADLAVGVNAGIIKTGSVSRAERTSKYNQLIRIEQELGAASKYAGLKAFKGQN